ncbi:MAG: hypothetical protein RIC14_14700 [Filomicrobium sp.]
MMINNLFLLAIAAFGWGLSLATYRLFARQYNWPMGALHADLPVIPVLIGIVSFLSGLGFAVAIGADLGGWIIIGCGFLLAIFWTGFLRVGSQISIFLAPLAAFMLIIGWFAIPLGFGIEGWQNKTPGELLKKEDTGYERDYVR